MIPILIDRYLAEEHYEAVKPDILDQIERVLNDGGIKKSFRGNYYWINYSDQLENDLEAFISEPDNNLKPLIVQGPGDLENSIIGLYLNKFSYIDNFQNDYDILYNIFISNVYERKFNKWGFINKIKIDTCPYCNRNYIFTSKKDKKIKPEIDHFYPKNLYPILGMSYFNLIPSCEYCNGQACKHTKDPFSQRLVNPYLVNDSDFIITHKINNIAIINPLSGKSDVEVFFKVNDLIKPHLDIFNLRELYDLHYDHAIELIIKRNLKYSKKYRDYLRSYKGIKFSNAEINRMILGNYSLKNEQHKRPLSKLYQDIGRELGLI